MDYISRRESAGFISRLASRYSAAARAKRRAMFLERFELTHETRILDVGSADGTHIQRVLRDTPISPSNVYIADIDERLVRLGAKTYGYQPVPISESGRIPFEDGYFDIVWSSSVIEHVTIPKAECWKVRSGRQFASRSFARQQEFAREIRRVGKNYWVQTPARSFWLESHSWLPFIGWLPRPLQLIILRAVLPFWPKQTTPDWHLLTRGQVAELFPGADILSERSFGMTKSWIATRRVARSEVPAASRPPVRNPETAQV
jgi:SAM-dependent methyltransferase